MEEERVIAVIGTFDSKAEEHLFLRDAIQGRGFKTAMVHLGTKGPSSFKADYDLYADVIAPNPRKNISRDEAIELVIDHAGPLISKLHSQGRICGLISAGGGTGTYISTALMRQLPIGVPKVMVSTVASRDMAKTVGTKDITMIHSVVDILGVNSISGMILDMAAGAVCGMAARTWRPACAKPRIAMSFFGFVTRAAENIRGHLESQGYEVIPFHANGTGGTAMEELAAEGCFAGILDLATHELADELMGGYCKGIKPNRLMSNNGKGIPRLVIPGGLDCAVFEFTRETIPAEFAGRKLFFYDFRSAIRLDYQETGQIAAQLIEKLNAGKSLVKVLIPSRGWSEADGEACPLWDPEVSQSFVGAIRQGLRSDISLIESDRHINDPSFGRQAAEVMHGMVQQSVRI
ncbi:MAG: Tm-1-like ATP-binding domain-containing protein [Syntrophobacterales bacterium]|nr:Tm-1-like ATP-binding domain-containing protein [Syntrophobacterales bacterium]